VGGFRPGWWPSPAIVALYTVAAHCPRQRSLRAGAAALVVLAAPIFYRLRLEPSALERTCVGGGTVRAAGGGVAARRPRPDLARSLRAVEERAAHLERERRAPRTDEMPFPTCAGCTRPAAWMHDSLRA